eukprot:TRINITY_DN3677_c0_g1_i1.p1 TRINITY_DN3677_c0_g1~~TRINITY_DN3677_c0_g1_i1.p1  ORF type:complete len:359 (-),score=61.70 TRINITY_DN3677_c0_g1_i1:97-1173(-)
MFWFCAVLLLCRFVASDDRIFVGYTAAIPLMSGEAFFSDPTITQIERPDGRIAIRRFEAEIVDSSYEPVPLSEAYFHHGVVYTERFLGPCPAARSVKVLDTLGTFYFSGGAESRSIGNEVHKPYGWIFQDETFHGNFHVIRSSMVEDVKSCIECHCWDGDEIGGGVECCGHGSRCRMDLTQPNVNETKEYHIKYSFHYSPVDDENTTLDGDEVIPVDMFYFDSTDCELEFNVPKCQELWPASDQCLYVSTSNYTLDDDYEVAMAFPHLHIGGLEIEINVIDLEGTERNLCRSAAIYGTEEGVPGNEKGYLVDFNGCWFTETDPYLVYSGETVVVTSVYENSVEHDGVMGFYLLAMRRL